MKVFDLFYCRTDRRFMKHEKKYLGSWNLFTFNGQHYLRKCSLPFPNVHINETNQEIQKSFRPETSIH